MKLLKIAAVVALSFSMMPKAFALDDDSEDYSFALVDAIKLKIEASADQVTCEDDDADLAVINKALKKAAKTIGNKGLSYLGVKKSDLMDEAESILDELCGGGDDEDPGDDDEEFGPDPGDDF